MPLALPNPNIKNAEREHFYFARCSKIIDCKT